MNAASRRNTRHLQRGAVVVFVAIALFLMIGLAALTIDTGNLYVVRTELQAAADASAMAAALTLAEPGPGDPFVNARASADQYARLNSANHVTSGVRPSDVIFGSSVAGPSGKYVFTPNGSPKNAVRVTIRRSALTGNAVQFGFAHLLGKQSQDISATATAMLQPRDIAVAIDLSLSMDFDSHSFHSRTHTGEGGASRPGALVNLRDIWCALNGPAPTFPYVPDTETHTQYAGDSGPAVGAMTTWGNQLVTSTYDPSADPGLWYIKSGSSTTSTVIRSSVLSRGASSDEATQLMSGSQDGSYTNQWRNRAAVLVGFARWRSGRSGGLSGGDADNRVEDAELIWNSAPTFAVGWSWPDYIAYVKEDSSRMVDTDSRFQWRFGPKTYTDFLLEEKYAYNQTNVLWQTPEQPLRAVKDAVQTMVNKLVGLQSSDHVSLEVFALSGRHEVNLTANFQSVADRLYHMQAGHYDANTNIGGGIGTAIAELTSSRARFNAAKTIILLSDGNPNVSSSGTTSSGSPSAVNYATSEAQRAADLGIRIFTVSVGADCNRTIMQTIAAIGHGQEFYAHGTPEEYTEDLQNIFRQVGGKQRVMLVE